ncbi:DUF2628 domain-containing protein [Lacticaseibacillus hulanensis]|jgi:hypothetical protein|uniref:DUF2628 domain-containing protein n=1 Tax=Lacticaseibacillus hulanensis TaxID=2493111 RepID=UPI000FD7667E|nr:DUF2628 domain-containing protein [Lacticaseibacillus hulanensis]
MHVNLTSSYTGETKQVKVGYSWTTLFFGFFPALFRGDFKWFAIIALIEVACGSFTLGFGATLVTFIFSFIYNGLYIKDLLSKGFAPSSSADESILLSRGFRF